jgi:hypothetical protein
MDSVGQPIRASSAIAHSSGVTGWWWTTDIPMSSSRLKIPGVVLRHMSQSMQVSSM